MKECVRTVVARGPILVLGVLHTELECIEMCQKCKECSQNGCLGCLSWVLKMLEMMLKLKLRTGKMQLDTDKKTSA